MEVCIVQKCAFQNQELFRVPNAGSSRYRAWTKKVPISGLGTERICAIHFKSDDFNENIRKKLDRKAVPKYKLPTSDPKAVIKSSGCCVLGCGTRNINEIVKMPAKSSSTYRKWITALALTIDVDVMSLKVCHKHFDPAEFTIVRSRYLKSKAVPSKHLCPKPTKPLEFNRRVTKSKSLMNSGNFDYAAMDYRPRSRRMCFVHGCTVRATDGVFLHQFPKSRELRNAWQHAIKSALGPKKNSVVCSQHFHDSDYYAGTKQLKLNSVPSLNLPLTILEQNGPTRNAKNPYKHVLERGPSRRELHEQFSSAEDSNLSSITGHLVAPEEDHNSTDEVNKGDAGYGAGQQTLELLEELPFFGQPELHISENVDITENFTCANDASTKASIDRAIDDMREKRSDILSDVLSNDKNLNVWTGIPTMAILEALTVSAQQLEDCYPKRFKMHITDRIILTLARLKQNISFAALAVLFKVSPSTVSEYFDYTVNILAEILGQMIYWPSMEEISKNMPFCFRPDFANVRCVLDCTEIGISTPNCLNCRISCYSSYKHKRTAKILIGVTPAGMISYCSKAYSGKSSDKFIFNNEKFIDKLTMHRDELMVDKGFAIMNECIEKGIKLHIPPFLRDEQHSAKDAILNESIAKARVHVERAISRIKIFTVLQNSIDASMLKHIDAIMKIVCGVVNLTAPILRDDKF